MINYQILGLAEDGVQVVSSVGFTAHQQERVMNLGLPYGTEWGLVRGARSIKALSMSPAEWCITFSVVPSNPEAWQGLLKISTSPIIITLAVLYQIEEFCRLIRSSDVWVHETIKPVLESGALEAPVARAFWATFVQSEHPKHVRPPSRLSWTDWFWSQCNVQMRRQAYYQGPEAWEYWESYIRRLFRSSEWQRTLARQLPMIAPVLPRHIPPTFATLTLSPSEPLDIAVVALPGHFRTSSVSLHQDQPEAVFR
jgi:hypothetical protein